VFLRNTSSQGIKKQGDYWGLLQKKRMHLMRQEIRLIAICRIKLINSNNYSPTNKSLFCLLKLLTSDLRVEEQLGNLTSQDEIRTLLYIIIIIIGI